MSAFNYDIAPNEMVHIEGFCWQVKMPEGVSLGDSSALPKSSSLLLTENGVLIGKAGATHQDIIDKGRGRYSHWENYLYFSSSDNSNPVENGSVYRVVIANDLFGSDETGHLFGLLARTMGDQDKMARFEAVEDLVSQLLPEYRLADWGRNFVNDRKLSELYTKVRKKLAELRSQI